MGGPAQSRCAVSTDTASGERASHHWIAGRIPDLVLVHIVDVGAGFVEPRESVIAVGRLGRDVSTLNEGLHQDRQLLGAEHVRRGVASNVGSRGEQLASEHGELGDN